VATITFDRPETRNAIGTLQDCADIVEAIERAENDSGISCIILTGTGTAFSAGGDLKAMKEKTGVGRTPSPIDTRPNYRRGVHKVARALWECEVPMIAAINGHAIGLGLDLACLCDMRLAASSAKFASSFIKIGLVMAGPGFSAELSALRERQK